MIILIKVHGTWVRKSFDSIKYAEPEHGRSTFVHLHEIMYPNFIRDPNWNIAREFNSFYFLNVWMVRNIWKQKKNYMNWKSMKKIYIVFFSIISEIYIVINSIIPFRLSHNQIALTISTILHICFSVQFRAYYYLII